MAAKNESPAPAAGAVPATEAAPVKSGGGFGAWLPAIVAVLAAPAASFAVAQWLLLPRLRDALDEAPAKSTAHAESGGHGESAGGHGKPEDATASTTYKFENVVVNLAGTMGTRYLKSTFVVTGSDPALAHEFETRKTQLLDVTLNVLSSLSLADLEEAGAKNIIREKLVAAYNQTLGRRVAEQVYFSDFVVQ